ncbi:DNA mismatch repair protein Mlh3 isoform X2 [Rhipicephalus sanguineus]|uniref:DNA mismatch repair protein Mlh3 isoform X2 n=1 Tax=Rhipicephalus sanguineus TaxID=34632 RepID=UPI0018939DC5|nr:DNA mismatch repair protein Mlh3 isoform X2 [Rhipicephalus sanguineus]
MELHRLPTDVVSKLRSGVAIVSVAHCMEELVLNALDAGATCVAVRLNLPYYRVQVVDNGHGIPREQLENCGERYCTSKCRTLSDLEHPKFYGYRGEAISSIVEMSGIVQIESRSRTSTDSWCKTFARGKLRELAPSTTDRPSIGTTVTVLDFMYNLPVRRGCLSEAIDFEFCLQHLEGIALSHPEVSFTLRNDVTEEKHFQTHRTNSVLDIFAQLFGAQRAATLKHTLIKKKHFAVEAYISLEGHTSKQLQFVYLNKRLLRKTRIHKLFHNVIKKYVLGFHAKSAALCGSPSKLRNKQPVFVIFINCTSRTFDVTYEPQKTFVEFTDWDKITKLFEQLLNDFLHKHGIISHNFVINGELAFSQKTPPECEPPTMRTDPNINVEDMPNALVSMKVCRKEPCVVAEPDEEESDALEDITTFSVHSVSGERLRHTEMPLVRSSNVKSYVCQSRDVGAPKAVIALPPSFSAVSNTRPLLRMPENETPFDISKSFAKRGHPRSASSVQACGRVKQCEVPEHCPTGRHRPAHHHQNEPREADAARAQLSEMVDKLPQKKTNCHKRVRFLAAKPTPCIGNTEHAPVCMKKKREAAAIRSNSNDESLSRKLHCKFSHAVSHHHNHPKKIDVAISQQTDIVDKSSHEENNCLEKIISSNLELRSHIKSARDASGATCTKARQLAAKYSHWTEKVHNRKLHHKDQSSEVSNAWHASDNLLPDLSCMTQGHHDHTFSQIHTCSTRPTPLATKLRRRMKAHIPMNEHRSATSASFAASDAPSCQAAAYPHATSESFIKTADFRCLCLQAQQLCPVHGTEIILSKVPRFSPPTLPVNEKSALDESIKSVYETQKFTPEVTLSQPFTCSDHLECYVTQSKSEEASTTVVQGTQPFVPQSEITCSPAALEIAETASTSGSSIEIDCISSSEELAPFKMSEEGSTCSTQATPSGANRGSPGNGPLPAATRSSFSLTRLKLIQNNSRHLAKSLEEGVTHSLFSKSTQNATSQGEMLTKASCDTISPRVEDDNSGNIEATGDELGGLTQPSPAESQQSSKCKEPGTFDAHLANPKEGTTTIPGGRLTAITNELSRADMSTVEMYPGNWAACVDPTSGEKVFINIASGNSSFTLPSICLEQKDPEPIEALDLARQRNFSLAPAPFVPQFQPRPQDERSHFGCSPGSEQADVANMVRVWNNPALSCSTAGQDTADGGLLSKGSGPLYRITESYKFRKEMLTYVQVIGQVDAKFIACLMPLSQNRVKESLIVLFDQHAAHERVRLEWLLENQYEARGQARCVRSMPLSSELTVALEPDSLRRAAICEREMRKLGIHYTIHEHGVSFKRLPVCLLEKDESEQRAGRPSALASRMEELLRDHTETLLGTRHSAITLPKFLMDVLSSQACHGAIRFGSFLEKSECKSILKALSKCTLPFQCAHGRPSLMPIVDLRFLPPQKECRKPNLTALLSRLNNNVSSPEMIVANTD